MHSKVQEEKPQRAVKSLIHMPTLIHTLIMFTRPETALKGLIMSLRLGGIDEFKSKCLYWLFLDFGGVLNLPRSCQG